ncbi:MAG: hypothetical protein PHS54_00220 [Clostridia bacterium]|nr:hypothetical protein [Clostridia bacterium]
MRVSQGQLLTLLQRNVLELRFFRRRDKPGWNNARRMLVTLDREILNSAPGRLALHFKPPTHAPAYNYFAKNLICGWDLFWQDWRMIPVESCDIVTIIPTTPPDLFWNYFNIYLQAMSPSDKIQFMNN